MPVQGWLNLCGMLGGQTSCQYVRLHHYEERSLDRGSDAAAIAYIEIAGGFIPNSLQGIGIHSNIVTASILAILSAVDRALQRVAQAGLKALGQLQADFIASFHQLSKPKFLAGQVLEYMTHFPQPTRSEVVHLYDIQKAGFDGIVISDETAVGQYPDKVAEFLQEFLFLPQMNADERG